MLVIVFLILNSLVDRTNNHRVSATDGHRGRNHVVAFHGRGWSQDRREVDYQMRCMASRNEVFLNLKHRSPYIFWAVLKYLLVRLLHV